MKICKENDIVTLIGQIFADLSQTREIFENAKFAKLNFEEIALEIKGKDLEEIKNGEKNRV